MALFDELSKIGESHDKAEAKPRPLRRAISTALISGAGTGVGMGLAHEIGKRLSKNQPSHTGAQVAKIILPILGGAAVVLGNELRRMKQERYKSVPGWKENDSA